VRNVPASIYPASTRQAGHKARAADDREGWTSRTEVAAALSAAWHNGTRLIEVMVDTAVPVALSAKGVSET